MTTITTLNSAANSNNSGFSLKSSRSEAVAAGDSHYLGRLCPHGHASGRKGPHREPASLRTTKDKQCTQCAFLHNQVKQTVSGQKRSTQTAGATFQGAPCRYLHSGVRYVSNGKCCECVSFDNAARKPGWQRENDMLARYGISKAVYAQMENDQFSMCAICGMIPKGKLDVDHCHASGVVRGLLCRSCNVRLGTYRENPALLDPASIAYLERYNTRLAA